MKTFGERLQYVRKKKKFTQDALAAEIGVSSQKIVSNWESGVAKPETETIILISKFLEVSIDWLLTGAKGYNIPEINTMVMEENYKPIKKDKPRQEEKQQLTKAIPFYDNIQIAAGYNNYIQDGHEVATDFINIPWFHDCTMAFPIAGDSMYPRLQAGEILLCKELSSWRDFVPFGEIFVVITESLRTVKYVKRSDEKNKYRLVSENPHYEPFDVDISHILNMLIVKGTIKRSLI